MRVRSRTVRGDVVGTSRAPGGGRTAAQPVSGVFRATLDTVEEELIRGDLDQLMEEVDRSAAELRRWRGKNQLEAYKRAIRSFLQVALEKMFRVHSEMHFDARGSRVRSVVVEAIDEHLEALTDEILHGTKSMVPLAARLDEIRGLLLDLYG